MSLYAAAALALTSHLRFALKGGTIAASVATTLREKSATICTLTTASAHGLYVGATVTVSGISGASAASYNGVATVLSVPSTTTFTYAELSDTAAEASTADTGGTVAQSGTVSSSVKPIATSALWLTLGDVEEDPDYDGQPEANLERIVPVQGHLVRSIQPGPFSKPMMRFKTSQITSHAVALALSGAPPASGATQFNPQSGVGAVEGWLKGMHLDSADAARIVFDCWGVLSLAAALKIAARDFIKPEFKFEVSHNTLNTVYIS